ncbi:MAG: polysaccharide deacetylase family protein [Planctomycetes bacterium]|nr:polysaccharide deacetylase family protein [Planctomycetota bacterium]MCH9723508.1 polysaccharide deacetylase family protein [Planctomycetota bacterium]MCH9775301.1 polysaccharide deacetylase family protein [Planctomycetota bacterium]MCH9789212.1 polysaccharide deacetylase family protein [Planctomycetota bacterium]
MKRLLCLLLLLASCAFSFTSVQAENNKPDGKRYVIIHADDAGMSHSVNLGTIEGMEKGIVSSASIMVPCPWFKEFADYAKNHPEGDYGIHLTLNSEWKNYRWGPVASRDQVPSLLDEENYLWDNVGQVMAHVNVKDAEKELRAQIERARKFGVPLSHLDMHMGAVVSRPDLLQIYVNLGIEYDLPVLFVANLDPKKYGAIAARAKELKSVLQKNGLPVLDELLQFYGERDYTKRKNTYLESLRNLKPGVTQIIIHCGIDNQELQNITNSSSRRDGDRRVFTDPEVMKLIKDQGIEVITWKQFHKMARKKVAPAK